MDQLGRRQVAFNASSRDHWEAFAEHRRCLTAVLARTAIEGRYELHGTISPGSFLRNRIESFSASLQNVSFGWTSPPPTIDKFAIAPRRFGAVSEEESAPDRFLDGQQTTLTDPDFYSDEPSALRRFS